MRKIIIILAFLTSCHALSAQFLIDSIPEVSVELEKEHLIGIKYGYGMNGAMFSFDAKEEMIYTPVNYGLFYTYYHPMWGFMNYFGIQAGVNYARQGFKTNSGYFEDETWETVYATLISQFKFDAGKRIRILINAGGFGGYRFATDKQKGFDCFDNRIEYGAIGGLGLGFKFHPFELHLEGNYKHSFSFLFHPEKLSSKTWIYTYPYQIQISLALLYKLPF